MRLSLAAALLAAGFSPIAAQQPPADMIPPRQAQWREIRAVNDSMEAAFNRGDMKAVSRFYADDAKMVGGSGPPVTGRAAFDSYWATAGAHGGTWKLSITGIGGSRDLAYQTGRSILVQKDAAGRERTSTVDFALIWRRDAGGGLRILMDLY